MTKPDIVDIYLECGDFHKAVKESGLPVYIAHVRLLKSGVLKIQDKINYGSRAAKLGGKAEEMFQRYVPEAIDANTNFQKNNPIYDFYFKNVTIDVKYSSLLNRSKSKQWSIRVKGKQDFICAFLESEKSCELDNPYCLLIPTAFFDQKDCVTLTESGMYFQEFQIEPDKLQETLESYVELRKEGLF